MTGRRPSGWSTGRCTRQAQALVRAGVVVLRPRQRGDEHRGQRYELTDSGRAELARWNEIVDDDERRR